MLSNQKSVSKTVGDVERSGQCCSEFVADATTDRTLNNIDVTLKHVNIVTMKHFHDSENVSTSEIYNIHSTQTLL